MKVNNYRLAFLVIFILCTVSFIPVAAGQNNTKDSIQYQDAIKQTIGYYSKKLDINSAFYNGYDYQFYPHHITGNPYFQDSVHFDHGTVNYNDVEFSDVPLLYDVHQDILISFLQSAYFKFSLVNERVTSFSFNGHQFVRVSADTTNLKTGFYEELYHSDLRVLSKLEAAIQGANGSQGNNFERNIIYYLGKGRSFHKVKSEADVFAVLKDQKTALVKYLDQVKIKFRLEPAKAIVSMARYYDRLTK